MRFYERREIRDAIAYLRAIVNPADDVSVRRILNVLKRGIGDRAEAATLRWPPPSGSPLRRPAARRRGPGQAIEVAENDPGLVDVMNPHRGMVAYLEAADEVLDARS